MDRVIIIPVLGDNFAYLYHCGGQKAFAVDPSDASAVLRAVTAHDLQLDNIFATHSHHDHTAGIPELKKKTGCRVLGPDKTIPGLDTVVTDGDTFKIGKATITVLSTPGHTDSSVCYFVETDSRRDVFTGDTMFAAGCGRVFTRDYDAMYKSLQEIASLPEDTSLYPGHDYTIEDYEFTLQIEPDNQQVKQRLREIRNARYTVPSTIAIEKQTNIFLRADQPAVKAALNMSQATDLKVFTELRRRKDLF